MILLAFYYRSLTQFHNHSMVLILSKISFIIASNEIFSSKLHFQFLECVSKVEKAKCDMVQGQCWCYVGEGVLPSSACGYPDGYSGEYYSIADALPWTKEISPWTILTHFGKVPHSKCGFGGCNSDGLHNACYEYLGCVGTS